METLLNSETSLLEKMEVGTIFINTNKRAVGNRMLNLCKLRLVQFFVTRVRAVGSNDYVQAKK